MKAHCLEETILWIKTTDNTLGRVLYQKYMCSLGDSIALDYGRGFRGSLGRAF